MASPQTLKDEGARAALDKALEEHSRNPSNRTRRGFSFPETATPASENGGSSRADSTEGEEAEQRMDELREGMEVFVDPGETNGLPSIGRRGTEKAANRQAWNLVRGYKKGGMGFLRHRKNADNAGFSSGHGENEEIDDDDEKKEKGGVGGLMDRIKANETPDERGVSAPPPMSGAGGASGGGILPALIALAQQNQQADSNATSAASSPATSTAVSRRNSDEEDSDEEEARRKFINKLRQKRASRQAWMDAPVNVGKMVGSGGKSVVGAGSALGALATGALSASTGGHRKSASESDRTSPYLHASGARSASNLGIHGDGNQPLTPNASGASNTPAAGYTKKKNVFEQAGQGVKRLGQTLGLEIETSSTRPEAARSSAGVFGGLILGTVRHILTVLASVILC
jgi:hypothetical protein